MSLIFEDKAIWYLLIPFVLALSYIGISFYYLIRYRRKGDERFDAFYVEQDKLVINSLFKPSYLLTDIQQVEVGYDYYSGHATYQGFIRILKTNGKKSRCHFFDANVHTRKFTMRRMEEDILLAVARVVEDFNKAKIPCVNVGFQRLYPFGWNPWDRG